MERYVVQAETEYVCDHCGGAAPDRECPMCDRKCETCGRRNYDCECPDLDEYDLEMEEETN
jgi:hypothetical protein